MDICEHCRGLFLTVQHALMLVEIEDRYGIWFEWLCDGCTDDLLDLVMSPDSVIERVALWNFDIPATG